MAKRRKRGGRTAKGRFRKGYHLTPKGRYVKGTKKRTRKAGGRRRRRRSSSNALAFLF